MLRFRAVVGVELYHARFLVDLAAVLGQEGVSKQWIEELYNALALRRSLIKRIRFV